MAGTYSVRIIMDTPHVTGVLRYATEDVISSPVESEGKLSMSYFLMEREEAHRLHRYFLISYPPSQMEGWKLLQIGRHSKWSPFPPIEILESTDVSGRYQQGSIP
jgi:hypothetical protein